jgi:hypothetical protein
MLLLAMYDYATASYAKLECPSRRFASDHRLLSAATHLDQRRSPSATDRMGQCVFVPLAWLSPSWVAVSCFGARVQLRWLCVLSSWKPALSLVQTHLAWKRMTTRPSRRPVHTLPTSVSVLPYPLIQFLESTAGLSQRCNESNARCEHRGLHPRWSV